MRTAEFDFELPPERIAQAPASSRDGSRLLVLHRASGRAEHRRFRDVTDFLRAGDVLDFFQQFAGDPGAAAGGERAEWGGG